MIQINDNESFMKRIIDTTLFHVSLLYITVL